MKPPVLTRRQLLVGGVAAAAAATIGLPFYTVFVEPHWMELVRRPMPLEHLPPELAGRTLLQVSDLHVGPRVSSDYLMQSLRRAQALTPDFVAITGDFVSYGGAHEHRELARVLATMPRGRLGTVASLGNHDYGRGWHDLDVADEVAAVVRDAGAVVLRNEVRQIGGLQFAGLGDFWSPEFARDGRAHGLWTPLPAARDPFAGRGDAIAAIRAIAPAAATVVLSHNPDAMDEAIWDGVRGWVLAGHTHGGQVKPPFLPPPVLPVRNHRYTAGAFDVGPGRTLYVSRGLGHLTQVRFNVRPEMTLFTLERA
jgi:predicted MPP superfamily phosphohydrolase